jgi:hypothetical protein
MLELINIALGEQGLRAVIVPLETAEPAPEPEKAKAKTKTKAVPKTEPAPAQSAEPSTIQDVEPQGTLTPPAKAPDKDTEETPEELYKKALDLLIRIHRGGGDGVSEKLEALKKTYGVTKFSLIDKDKGGELFKDAVKLAVDINFQG